MDAILALPLFRIGGWPQSHKETELVVAFHAEEVVDAFYDELNELLDVDNTKGAANTRVYRIPKVEINEKRFGF